jgi:signal transduction histidine kinase
MRSLIERSLSDVRLEAGLPAPGEVFSLRELIATVKLTAQLEAQVKGCQFTVSAVDPDLFVEGDRDLLLSAVGNLLQNAFKFTHRGSDVALRAYAVANRILIDVEDHCGGLAPGSAEAMFLPFKQMSEDRSGLGLGLSIARRSVIANHGSLSVRNLPGSGCVFTINIPRHSRPQQSSEFDPSVVQHESA